MSEMGFRFVRSVTFKSNTWHEQDVHLNFIGDSVYSAGSKPQAFSL